MRVRIDQQADAVYLDLTGREIESSEEVADGIIVDYDKAGRLVGIEILDASKKAGDVDALRKLAFDVPHIAA
ncbi:MAG: DUF2283 domain-containing protein [Candidatus Muproteobacteria bacterium RIFCSPHIGHO2_12_FULL_60_33]|uniref:DUF2283 domain-containing protein n=1 Tax=Candidatus Muproteobacteria bacterium RIFCSPLOWO2_01_FULL_60_18 TaxID=1817768 RepID=A0A1F6U449_9PROT|nr:MAG: DUF2283 domain-containing protein [Candidatus Muproteobacteria bacterium RIFCSPHIGHO2_01_60_12]OGI52166.1 MAG: DUF2283 domain-containing protein [Candidatus Muproteobacteria bacterium RIFCSPLOWO2_01_FULL_60_18]OGI53867.1 MAG: DUF2283 domain-containing protein [Candidatus Muproteobacteria bacterium RIFCSPHIGHO2_02_FULL_60_13]OGI54510.1 MAG: DUF2283 domain-containing protein [Candidatus Muproteobacteria bacterium RIFCSPHIGHO2_12_FULL_60_33]